MSDPIVELTGPGGAFEIVVEDVLGHPTQVYKQRMTSLRGLMEQNALRADVDFVVQNDVRLTFGEHDRLARVLAKSLADLGVGSGDRVALVSANIPEWVVTFWAAAILGATLVPLNAWWKAEELEFGITNSEAKVLIGDARRMAILADVTLPTVTHRFEIGTPEFDALLQGDDPGMPETVIDEDDLLAICYTSGTTGQPKGATLTHRQVIANLQNIIVLGIASAMRGNAPPEASTKFQSASLLVVPLFHVTGCLSTMTVNYATGGKLVLMPVGKFDPEVAMQIIERERVTAIGGVPTIMWRILESPNLMKYDLSSVQRASYGGAPAAPELVERIEQVFPHMRKTLTTAYGLTETASVATAHGGDDYFSHPGSVGKAAPTIEIRVVEESGVDAPAGERGEVWIKGPTVMNRGYWRRPDANEASFSDGWFHTGDIGYLDADGFLFLVDRAKDMIIRGGENVYCVEVENVIFDHPDVIDAAVVGVPHKTLGEEVKAVVQLKEGSTATADDIRQHAMQHLANFKVPEYVEIRSEPLPRNPAGKVLKNELRGNETSFAASDDQAL
ncbi:MAG TPA: class I adenylate-forming enzyme family protein [Acidimicrobiia bacterium]|nr:class I adenylate-forming enzyme family protein [Acidimicrobiia bacterium]